MEENPSNFNEKQEDLFDFHELVERYVAQWKWFAFGIFVCLVIATLYLRYAVPIYNATATILVRDEKKGGVQSQLSAFSDLGLMAGVKSNVDNEIEVIRSRSIIGGAVKKLGFNISYTSIGRVKTIEQYEKKPVEFSFYDTSENFYNKRKSFILNFIDDTTFELIADEVNNLGRFKYGAIINLDDSKLVINKNAGTFHAYSKEFPLAVQVHRINDVIDSFRGRLSVVSISKNSSVVSLSINDPVKQKAEDFLNTLIAVYNEDAISDKKFISENTLSFIQGRLKIITSELGDVEKDAEVFKKSNQVTDINTQAGIYLNNSVDFSKNLIETETQIKVVLDMISYVKAKGKWDLVPNNLISNADGKDVANFITEYNDLIIQRNRIVKDGTQNNSIVINLEQKIEDLNANITSSLLRTLSALRIRKANLDKQDDIIKGRISKLPTQEREFRILARQQQIKESLYLYLLQKREETAISLAVTEPISKIVDQAFSSDYPVSPRRNIVYLIAIMFGMLVPFSIIYIRHLFDNKIKSRQDLEGKLSAPYLGDIPRSESHEEIINTNSKSSSAEAIRIVRTNLEFMTTKIPESQCRTIFVTSTIPKEGKTFVAINLASTIALSGKKVLLIGLDIRNPKIDRYVQLPSQGLTNYLSKANEDIDNYIVKFENFESFYVLPSGVVPPNPVDLLMNGNIDTMFEKLKQEYDYIIVDTAPVSLVTDTMLVAKNADIFIYVIRANFIDKRLIKMIEAFYRQKRLPNMAVLLNDTEWRKPYTYGYGAYGYGYGYGYGYAQEQESAKRPWHKWFKK
jgi:tyrosine-protein kinase Etk/Wzc